VSFPAYFIADFGLDHRRCWFYIRKSLENILTLKGLAAKVARNGYQSKRSSEGVIVNPLNEQELDLTVVCDTRFTHTNVTVQGRLGRSTSSTS
jgi:hypothetical protein